MPRKRYVRVNATVEEGESVPFWRRLRLDQMSREQWESLCDGCARCCLNKLEDEDTGEIAWTSVACRLLDSETCRCSNYANRNRIVPDCIQLDPEKVASLSWLPATCAYRLVHEEKDLYWWHHLVSGDFETVHLAGISVRDKTVNEEGVPLFALEDFIVEWPNSVPSPAPKGVAPVRRRRG